MTYKSNSKMVAIDQLLYSRRKTGHINGGVWPAEVIYSFPDFFVIFTAIGLKLGVLL
jgi:hypothetical protein